MWFVDPGKGVDLRIDRDEGIVPTEIARLAGAEIFFAVGVGNGGGASVMLDPVDQPRPLFRVQKVVLDQQCQIAAWKALYARQYGETAYVGIMLYRREERCRV